MPFVRVITGAGANLEVFIARSTSFHLHSSEAARSLRRRRFVTNRVLVPDVVRNLLGDRVHVVIVFREEGDSAGLFGDESKGALRTLGGALLFLVQQTNRLNRRTAIDRKLADRRFQVLAAGVVLTIGNDQ